MMMTSFISPRIRSYARRSLVLILIAYAVLAAGPGGESFPVQAAPFRAEGETSIGDPYAPELGNTGYDVTHYDLNLKFDFEQASLTGIATLSMTATIDNLARFALDFAVLKADSVTLNDKPVRFEQRDANQKLVITPNAPLHAGAGFTVQVRYSGKPKPFESRYLSFLPIGMYMETDTRRVFAVNQPDAAHSWFPCNDHPRDRATYSYTITVPEDRMAVANGQQQGDPVENGDGTHTYRWVLKSEMSSYLATVAVADYVRTPLPNPLSGISLAVYAYQGEEQGVLRAFGATDSLVELFTRLFGPYPFESYGQLLVHQDSVGLEAQTMTIVPDSFSRADPARIYTFIAHELAHQWFGDAVSVDTWRDIWLNEGFATYAEFLALEASRGKGAALRLVNGWETNTRLAVGSAPVTNPSTSDMFGINTYLKGGFVLYMLREKIGDDAFFRTLQTYFRRYSGKTATTADFEAVATEVSGADLKSFFSTWLDRSEIPTVRLSWVQAGGTIQVLACQITEQPFSVSIPYTLDGVSSKPQKASETLTLSQKETRLSVSPGFMVGDWEIDPQNVILATVIVNQVSTLPASCTP